MSLRGGPRRGTVLPPGYRILARLHRSNHFDVFDAWDEARGCRCVIKTPRPDRRDHPRTRRQLLREGRRLERWAHPHLVRAWAVHTDPQPFVVMETLTGETLSHLIDTATRPLPARQAAWLGLHLSSAVGFLHAQGVLHLDLKPSNIVAAEGRAIIIDLSVSRAPGRMRGGLGTWGYMAPEQLDRGPVDGAADVWGIGAVLFEAATGEPACDDDARTDAVTQRWARTRGPFAAVVRACLHQDPAERPTLPELERRLASVAGVAPYPPR